MNRLMLAIIGTMLIAVAGCGGVTIEKNPDMVAITGKVTKGGAPVDGGVSVSFQPVGKGAGVAGKVEKGQYTASIFPGEYTYYVTQGSIDDTQYEALVPEKMRAGDMARVIEVKGAMTLDVTLE